MNLLAKDPVRNANVRHFAERYGIESSRVIGDSVLIRGSSDHTWVYLLPACPAEGRLLLEPFRRLGYGAALTHWMIRRVRERGGIPFVHIEAANAKSLNLARKTGFEPCGETWWVKGKLKPEPPRES